MSNRNTPASLAGPIPPFINLTEVEELATLRMSKMAYDYYAAGAETEQSVADNKLAFAKYRILPRILVDVSKGIQCLCQCLLPPWQCMAWLIQARSWALHVEQQPANCHW
eukprot:GHRR01029331.1.p1 GENE.GHRR01029331.1~~GHRR01029331.1.p1  ORF type:complete len:110 (+),score=19.06 GHRR01029331.1:329-658(+)